MLGKSVNEDLLQSVVKGSEDMTELRERVRAELE